MVNKKAQFKIQQTAFVLLAITLFFVLVGIFVIIFKFSGLTESANVLEQENAMLLVSKMANSPEFSCGNSFGTGKFNCVDADKIMVLKEDISNYKDFWGVQNVEIRKVYPESEILCNRGNYPNCGIIRLFSEQVSGYDASNYISLCRKQILEDGSGYYDKCEIAKLMVSYDEK